MIIHDDRSALDTALKAKVSLCILRGAENSTAGKVHGCMEGGDWGEEPWQKWFLVTNQDRLTDEEREAWYGNDNGKDYAFLGRNSKATVSNGAALADLMETSEEPPECDFITFIEKFAEADLQ